MDPIKQRWLLAILGIVVAIVWIPNLTGHSTQSQSRPVPPEAVRPVASSAVAQATSSNPDWGINPFLKDRKMAAMTRPTGLKEHSLGGILWDERSPSALIDNRTVRVGDRVGRWMVVEIQRDRVILSDEGTQKILRTK